MIKKIKPEPNVPRKQPQSNRQEQTSKSNMANRIVKNTEGLEVPILKKENGMLKQASKSELASARRRGIKSYVCTNCGKEFESKAVFGEEPRCPKC